MDEFQQKLRSYRTLIYVLAFILFFEIIILSLQIPEKTTFTWITLLALGFLCLYLIVLCIRLVKELQDKENNR